MKHNYTPHFPFSFSLSDMMDEKYFELIFLYEQKQISVQYYIYLGKTYEIILKGKKSNFAGMPTCQVLAL